MLGTKILTTSAYHPQADGQSERTNQTAETAIRFIVTNMPPLDFKDALPALQAQSNNSSTGLSLNEIIYGFKVREGISAVNRSQLGSDQIKDRPEFRSEAADAICYANAKMKIYYDSAISSNALRLEPSRLSCATIQDPFHCIFFCFCFPAKEEYPYSESIFLHTICEDILSQVGFESRTEHRKLVPEWSIYDISISTNYF